MSYFEQNKPVIAEWARRVANDESLDGFEYNVNIGWYPVTSELNTLGPDWFSRLYRFAPKTVKINGYEVVAPMSVKPEKVGDEYYYFDQGGMDCVFHEQWGGSGEDDQSFKFGIFTNKEDARRYGLALHNIDPNTPVEEL